MYEPVVGKKYVLWTAHPSERPVELRYVSTDLVVLRDVIGREFTRSRKDFDQHYQHYEPAVEKVTKTVTKYANVYRRAPFADRTERDVAFGHEYATKDGAVKAQGGTSDWVGIAKIVYTWTEERESE